MRRAATRSHQSNSGTATTTAADISRWLKRPELTILYEDEGAEFGDEESLPFLSAAGVSADGAISGAGAGAGDGGGMSVPKIASGSSTLSVS